MQAYIAKTAGRYLVQTVNGREIRILGSEYLEVGEHVLHPDDAFVLHIVVNPEVPHPKFRWDHDD